MAGQLIFTSAPMGLNPGSSGYCTVACSEGMREALVARLEQLSVYRRLRGGEEPVIHSHRIVTLRESSYHVLSRISACELDHTHRSNFVAHHLVFEGWEIRQLPSPAEILAGWDGWWTRKWEGDPRRDLKTLDQDVFFDVERTSLPAQRWLERTGDAGHAAGLVADRSERVCLTIPPARETELLQLFSESLRLLDPDRKAGDRCWGVAFTTFLQEGDDAADFRWIGAWPGSAGHAIASAACRLQMDLTAGTHPPPQETDLVRLARKGSIKSQTEAKSMPSPSSPTLPRGGVNKDRSQGEGWKSRRKIRGTGSDKKTTLDEKAPKKTSELKLWVAIFALLTALIALGIYALIPKPPPKDAERPPTGETQDQIRDLDNGKEPPVPPPLGIIVPPVIIPPPIIPPPASKVQATHPLAPLDSGRVLISFGDDRHAPRELKDILVSQTSRQLFFKQFQAGVGQSAKISTNISIRIVDEQVNVRIVNPDGTIQIIDFSDTVTFEPTPSNIVIFSIAQEKGRTVHYVFCESLDPFYKCSKTSIVTTSDKEHMVRLNDQISSVLATWRHVDNSEVHFRLTADCPKNIDVITSGLFNKGISTNTLSVYGAVSNLMSYMSKAQQAEVLDMEPLRTEAENDYESEKSGMRMANEILSNAVLRLPISPTNIVSGKQFYDLLQVQISNAIVVSRLKLSNDGLKKKAEATLKSGLMPPNATGDKRYEIKTVLDQLTLSGSPQQDFVDTWHSLLLDKDVFNTIKPFLLLDESPDQKHEKAKNKFDADVAAKRKNDQTLKRRQDALNSLMPSRLQRIRVEASDGEGKMHCLILTTD